MPITDAEAPFDDLDADLIIRSSDDVDFRVFKVFLSKTSFFFEGMFRLPQGPSSRDQMMRGGLPVITMAEKSSVVKHILQCCYPISLVGELSLSTLTEIISLLAAARKYEMVRVEAVVRCALIRQAVLEKHALQIYAIAVAQRWEKEVRIAARQLLEQGPPWKTPYSNEIESITGGDIHRLHRYFMECSKVAKMIPEKTSWPKLDHRFSGFGCPSCRQRDKSFYASAGLVNPNLWFIKYLKAAAEALSLTPCGAAVLEPAFLDQVLQLQAECAKDHRRCDVSALVSDLRNFAKDLAAEIDQAISRVCITSVINNHRPEPD